MLTKNVMPKFEMSKFNDVTRDKEAYHWTKFTTKGFIKEKKIRPWLKIWEQHFNLLTFFKNKNKEVIFMFYTQIFLKTFPFAIRFKKSLFHVRTTLCLIEEYTDIAQDRRQWAIFMNSLDFWYCGVCIAYRCSTITVQCSSYMHFIFNTRYKKKERTNCITQQGEFKMCSYQNSFPYLV